MTGLPIYNVNNNCATGSSALFLAYQLISGNVNYKKVNILKVAFIILTVVIGIKFKFAEIELQFTWFPQSSGRCCCCRDGFSILVYIFLQLIGAKLIFYRRYRQLRAGPRVREDAEGEPQQHIQRPGQPSPATRRGHDVGQVGHPRTGFKDLHSSLRRLRSKEFRLDVNSKFYI